MKSGKETIEIKEAPLEKVAVEDPSPSEPPKKRNWLVRYFRKWKGEKVFGSPKLQPWAFMVFSFMGAFIGIGVLGLISQYWYLSYSSLPVSPSPRISAQWCPQYPHCLS